MQTWRELLLQIVRDGQQRIRCFARRLFCDPLQLSHAKQCGVLGEVSGDFFRREPSIRVVLVAFASDCGFLDLFGRREHLLRAKGEAVHLSCLAGPSLIAVEGGVNATQDGFQRNSRFLPGLDQSPVERGEKQQRAAPPLEVFFDFSEVIEVVVQETI